MCAEPQAVDRPALLVELLPDGDPARQSSVPDGAAAPGRNGKNPGPEVVALDPLHQTGVDPLAHPGLENLGGAFLGHDHPLDQVALNVEGIAADRGALGQRKIEVAGQHPRLQVEEGQGHGGFGQMPDDARLDLHVGELHLVGPAVGKTKTRTNRQHKSLMIVPSYFIRGLLVPAPR